MGGGGPFPQAQGGSGRAGAAPAAGSAMSLELSSSCARSAPTSSSCRASPVLCICLPHRLPETHTETEEERGRKRKRGVTPDSRGWGAPVWRAHPTRAGNTGPWMSGSLDSGGHLAFQQVPEVTMTSPTRIDIPRRPIHPVRVPHARARSSLAACDPSCSELQATSFEVKAHKPFPPTPRGLAVPE